MHQEVADVGPSGAEARPRLFARVWRIEGAVHPDSATVATLVDTVLTRIERLPGYRGGYFLAATEGEGILTITFWNSLEELHAADVMGKNAVSGTMVVTAGTSMSVDVYDVLMRQSPLDSLPGERPV